MNTIEEQLWNYIDGNCTPVERLEIEAKLAVNIQYHTIYQELLKVNEELNKIDFEEPSMSFTRNVMDKVNLELKPVALQTKVDNRIINGIGAFFILALASIFIYAGATSDLSFKIDMPKVDFSFDTGKYINSTSMQIFLFVDLAIGLVYLDGVLRKRNMNAQKKGV
jgi:anti-sigma factor RsiW